MKHCSSGSAELGNQLSGRQSFGVEMLLVLQASVERRATRARDNKQHKEQKQPLHKAVLFTLFLRNTVQVIHETIDLGFPDGSVGMLVNLLCGKDLINKSDNRSLLLI